MLQLLTNMEDSEWRRAEVDCRICIYNPDTMVIYNTQVVRGVYVDSQGKTSKATGLQTPPITFNVPNGAKIRYGVIINTLGDNLSSLNTASFTGSFTPQYNQIVLSELTNNTTIFENGMGYKSSTSKYAVIINSDNNSDPVFEARNGNYAIKVCSDGIKIMRNGVWSTL